MSDFLPWRPWRSFEEIEKFFEREWPRFWPERVTFAPAVDVYQTDKDVVVETSLPGVDPEKIDVSVEEDTLSIKGSVEKKVEVKKEDYYRKEIKTGSFSRVVTLPVPVVAEKAKAEFENGILRVTIPKAKPTKAAKKITVKVLKKKK